MQGEGPPVRVVVGETPSNAVPSGFPTPTVPWPQRPGTPAAGGAPFRRPRGERARLVVAIVGMALALLLVSFVIGFLGPLVAFFYSLLGLIGIIVLVVGVLAVFVAFLAFLLTGRRAEPQYEAPATIESLETKQS